MTEAEWLANQYPYSMVHFLIGKATERKLRLLAVACCRRIIHLVEDEQSRLAIEVFEQYADNQASEEQLRAAEQDVASEAPKARGAAARKAASATANAAGVGLGSLGHVFRAAARALARDPSRRLSGLAAWDEATTAERQVQAELCRDIFGNPFRPSPPLPAALLAWNEGTVHRIAQTIYDERTFDRLPILADALEDAGCGNDDLVRHCRSLGPHVRGCWAVDLLLGKG
jgi:hypothetical protein